MRMSTNKNLVAHRRRLCEFREKKQFQCEECLMLFSHAENMKKHQKKACKGRPPSPPFKPQPAIQTVSGVTPEISDQIHDMESIAVQQSFCENETPSNSPSLTGTPPLLQKNNPLVFSSSNNVDQQGKGSHIKNSTKDTDPRTLPTNHRHLLTGINASYTSEAVIPFNINHNTHEIMLNSDLVNSGPNKRVPSFSTECRPGIINASQPGYNAFPATMTQFAETSETFGGLVPGIFQHFSQPTFPDREPLNESSTVKQTNTELENQSGNHSSTHFDQDKSLDQAGEEDGNKSEEAGSDLDVKDIKEEPPSEHSEDELEQKGRIS